MKFMASYILLPFSLRKALQECYVTVPSKQTHYDCVCSPGFMGIVLAPHPKLFYYKVSWVFTCVQNSYVDIVSSSSIKKWDSGEWLDYDRGIIKI